MGGSIPAEHTGRFIADHGLLREYRDVTDFGRYRFAIDIHANAGGLLES